MTSEERKSVTDWMITFFQNNDHWSVSEYNGRNFVKNCFGVDIGANDTDGQGRKLTLGKFFIEVAQQLFQEEQDCVHDKDGEFKKPPTDIVLEELENYKTDDLGMGMILYFPNLKWTDAASEALYEDE